MRSDKIREIINDIKPIKELEEKMKYDCTNDTMKHMKRVAELLSGAACELIRRGNVHDNSKLELEEKLIFDEFTPKLKGSTYGSEEYKQDLKEMKPALEHHYSNNPHHPECHANGINGMDLFDLIEMFFDWKAASERHANGNIMESIKINQERFGLSDQIVSILENTATELGFA
jgi:hypothetical protein